MRRSSPTPRRSPLVVLGCLALSAYFIHHAIQGSHGLGARSRFIERLTSVDAELARLEIVRAHLRRDVVLLAAEPPHRDLVEETAIAVLGHARPGDRHALLPLR